MACPLRQIQHQGLQTNPEKLVGQIYDPDDIREVEDLYKDRLAIREQVDWEGRLIGLQLMHLREFQALKSSSQEDDIWGGSLWNWRNTDGGLLEKIWDPKLKSKGEEEGL
ncbi:hypothetical protein N7533_004342 [Penicillium manginii]|uniref:uncharacterized protein n=1 Tax=Penicillium manginii TaxID=203109 RepID=UPI002547DBAF|nr:uncharacterized protein N7533_004342 [Penicillium manginii]KAJ5754799.1 hypothetical protein N7533_004342 [Penicillium manginii]